MVRRIRIFVLVGALVTAATPSFADDVMTPVNDVMTTVTTDINKGVAEFNPTEILTPKPIEAPAAAAPVKVKKKRYAKKRMKRKMVKK